MRHARDGMRIRKDNNIWSFGKLNTGNGYLQIGGKRIHQIVATAFLGETPTEQHVVVHIDTDRRNNRPDNLRWITKFEYLILTPHNCEEIRNLCGGSIEKLLENISILQDIDLAYAFAWIKMIDQDTASQAYGNLLEIAKTDKNKPFNSLDEWLIHRYEIQNRASNDKYRTIGYITQSLTKNAIQIKWTVPSEFPCCPQGIVDNPITSYFDNLLEDSLFCKNDSYKTFVLDAALSEDEKTIFVISESSNVKEAVKPWVLSRITYENPAYVHYSLGSFFTKIGAEKYFCLAQGKEWTGGDSIDDYC